jgi:hypothetical protein
LEAMDLTGVEFFKGLRSECVTIASGFFAVKRQNEV